MNRYENKLVVNVAVAVVVAVAVAVVVRWKSSKRENPAINVLEKKKTLLSSLQDKESKKCIQITVTNSNLQCKSMLTLLTH